MMDEANRKEFADLQILELQRMRKRVAELEAGISGMKAGAGSRIIERLRDYADRLGMSSIESAQKRVKELEKQVEKLRKALELIGPPMCDHLHHRKADYHESGPCPVEQRIERLIANEAEGGGDEH